jgi:hypothetical protein
LKEMGTNWDSKLFWLLNDRFTLKCRIAQQTPHKFHVLKDTESSASNRENGSWISHNLLDLRSTQWFALKSTFLWVLPLCSCLFLAWHILCT